MCPIFSSFNIMTKQVNVLFIIKYIVLISFENILITADFFPRQMQLSQTFVYFCLMPGSDYTTFLCDFDS